MRETGEGLGLPQMSEREMFEMLLSEDNSRTSDEPEIAANIGEQMLHMGLSPLSRSIRTRIRDICSRIPAKNVILVGGELVIFQHGFLICGVQRMAIYAILILLQ